MSRDTARRRRIALGVTLGLCAALCCAAEFPERLPAVKLDDVLWQVLPDGVRAVFVGPDDRVWYQLDHPAQRENLARVRELIAEQFNEPAPQVFGVRPVLFEDSGRVWFLTHSATVLLGYDGREWIEKAVPDGQFFTGNCPGHGRTYRYGWNLAMGRTLFFPDSHGVHTFDGREWRYQRLLDPSAPRGNRIVLFKEPGREALIAATSGSPPGVWRWAAGAWQCLPALSDQVASVLPATDEGVWLMMKNNALEFLPFVPPAPPRENVDTLFAKLKAAGADEERQAIGDQMIRLGALAKPELENALNRTYDPAVLRQLVRVLETIVSGRTCVAIGPYEVAQAFLLYCDAGTGLCFLRADNVRRDGNPLGKGLLIINGEDGPTFFRGEDLLQGWISGYSEESGPIPARDGRGIWYEVWAEGRQPRLLDPAAGRIVDTIPTPGFRWVHATRRDGTVFVGTREPGQPGVVLAAYRPGRKDARRLLPAVAQRLREGEDACAVDSDGIVWACPEEGRLSRFKDGRWNQVPELVSDSGFRILLPGAGQRLIGQSQQGCFYWTPEACTRHSSLRELIVAQRADLIRHFGAAVDETRSHGTYVTGLVADKSGNVWFMEGRKLSVLVDGQWIDAKPALLSAGSRLGEVEYLNTVGGRGSVFVSDFMSVHSGGKSHFGRVANGRPVFATAPHTCDRREMGASVRDAQDRLWIAGSIRGSGGTCDWITGQLALPTTDSGVAAEITNEGWAALCDATGNVWLSQARGGPPNEYRFWRDGAVTGRVRVPTADGYSRLVSDAPGSVYVWTTAGLYHLTARASPDKADFAVDRQYTVTNVPGTVYKMFAAAQGRLALSSYSDSGPRKHYLCLVRLPSVGSDER